MFVGDRGMITQAHAETFKEQGVGFISALKSAQIRSLVNSGDLQLSLFDEINLAEITSPLFPGERLVVCRNPAVAAERARKRAELLAATEAELAQGQGDGRRAPAARCATPTPGKIGSAPARSSTSTRSQSTSSLRSPTARSPTSARPSRSPGGRARRPLRDPHHLPSRQLSRPAAVRAYKQLKMAERAFRTMKDTIEIRPIHHHLETASARTSSSACSPTTSPSSSPQRLPPLLFTDETPLAPADPVAPATRSAANAKPPAPHRGRVPRPQPPRPARRPRHHLPQHHPHRPRRAHLHPPHQTHPATSPSPRTTRHQTPRRQNPPPPAHPKPAPHAGFGTPAAKLPASPGRAVRAAPPG